MRREGERERTTVGLKNKAINLTKTIIHKRKTSQKLCAEENAIIYIFFHVFSCFSRAPLRLEEAFYGISDVSQIPN